LENGCFAGILRRKCLHKGIMKFNCSSYVRRISKNKIIAADFKQLYLKYGKFRNIVRMIG
jgi:hypothetical protein